MGGLLGGGKPAFKPATNQIVEIEFEDVAGDVQAYFVEILEVSKKSLTLATPRRDMSPVNISPGIPMTVSYFDEGKSYYFTYQGSVKDSRDREFEVEAPNKNNVEPHEIAPRDDLFKIEVSIPVRFQARKTVHSQMASTHAVTPHSLFLRTNLGIPQETEIKVVLVIPFGAQIEVDAKAVGSEKDPRDNRKHISQVQLDSGVTQSEIESILSYAVYFQKRQERAEKRGEVTS